MNEKIKTTGQLRSFLANMMSGILNGEIDISKAGQITKLAGQINESFYAEVKVAKVRAEAGENMPSLGDLNIGSND
jgi:hypothetical protein